MAEKKEGRVLQPEYPNEVYVIYQPYTLQDVKDESAKEKFKVVSMFAGGGGSSTGYRLAGGKVLLINEFVEEARNTYSANYPDTKILPDDIRELTGDDILSHIGMKKGELDILDGSPPCSAFSIAGSISKGGGKHSDGWGKVKSYSDGKRVENIEDLFFDFIRLADQLQPKVVVAENVKGLTIGEAKDYYNRIINEFSDINYITNARVLNSKYYGVPQSRARVIFIAVRRDIADQLFINDLTIGRLFPEEKKSEIIPLKNAFCGVQNKKSVIQYLIKKWTKTSFYSITAEKMPKNPDKVLTGADFHPKGHHFNIKRCSAELPAPTITATGAKSNSSGAWHWCEERKFTIDELKRIMSLPDDFILTGKWNQRAERIGRMVPPLMMKSVAESIYENILKEIN